LGVSHLPQSDRRQALLQKVTPTKFDEIKGKKNSIKSVLDILEVYSEQ